MWGEYGVVCVSVSEASLTVCEARLVGYLDSAWSVGAGGQYL